MATASHGPTPTTDWTLQRILPLKRSGAVAPRQVCTQGPNTRNDCEVIQPVAFAVLAAFARAWRATPADPVALYSTTRHGELRRNHDSSDRAFLQSASIGRRDTGREDSQATVSRLLRQPPTLVQEQELPASRQTVLLASCLRRSSGPDAHNRRFAATSPSDHAC